MADSKISDLPSIAALQANDRLYVVRGGTDYGLIVPAKMVEDFVPVDHAGIRFDDNAGALTIDLQDVHHLITDWDTDGPDADSTADQANNQIVFGKTRTYYVGFGGAGQAVGAGQVFVVDAFAIDQNTTAITGITQANPGVVTAVGHGLSDGDHVKITGVVGMTEVNDKVFVVANKAADTFELNDDAGGNVNTGGFGAWVSGGTVALATHTGAHSDLTLSNASGLQPMGGHFHFAATSGDALELYTKNETSTNNLTFEGGALTVHALSYS